MTQTENITAALLLLKKMGVDPADLLQAPDAAPEIPTFADYIPRVSRAVSAGTRRLYTSYWNRVVDAWGTRLITEPSPLEISQFAEDIKANVVHRRNARGGVAAAEHLIGASAADATTARLLALPRGAPCLTLERRTWRGPVPLTHVRQVFPAGHYHLTAHFTPTPAGPAAA